MKAPAAKDDAHAAAQQLEAFFLRQVLAEARTTGDSSVDSGFAGDTFKQMFDEAVADKMSAAGGIGLSDLFAQQLRKGTSVASAPPSAAATMASKAAPIDATAAVSAATASEAIGAPKFVLPVSGRPSSGYGMRLDPIKHTEIKHPGFDLAAPTGTPVSAAAAGTVTHAGPAGTYGNLVTIRHENGFETRYAHLSAVSVQVGQHVAPGDPIGKVGTTGYSTGPHLHFEVRHDGATVDPAPLLPVNTSRTRPSR
ncbi:MAG TPA: peptidoglycan DD-metalloendopeptidase family protein [Kofleriaceae bacterium]